jgi:hypothetical protein
MEPPAAAGTQINTDKERERILQKAMNAHEQLGHLLKLRTDFVTKYQYCFAFFSSVLICVPAAAGGS